MTIYRKILVTLDHSEADEAILQHIEQLHAHIDSEVMLLHVADGWVARHFDVLQLKESDEIKKDREYLAAVSERLQGKGIRVSGHLALGEPADEIIRFAKEQRCDLIAMSTHGHRFLADLIRGTTATKVRHLVDIPVLLLKASQSR